MTGSSTTGTSGKASSPSATASMIVARRQHADLDGADVEIARHGVASGPATNSGGTDHHVVDALGVLRGQRGDGARAIDAERGEGLEIGLDAGAAR